MTLLDRLLALFGLTRTQVVWRWRRWKEDARQKKLRERMGAWVLPEGGYRYTGVIAGLNGVLFAAAVALARAPEALWGVPIPIMLRLGAWTVPHVFAGQAERLVMSIFLHFGILHLAFNTFALLQLGPLLEEAYGRSRFLALYLVTGIAGFVASVWWRSGGPEALSSIGAGASGAIFGLIGAGLMLSRRGSGRLASHIRGYVVQWAIYGLIMGFVLHADNVAHLGGMACGALFAKWVSPERVPRKGWVAIEVAFIALVILCFVRTVGS